MLKLAQSLLDRRNFYSFELTFMTLLITSLVCTGLLCRTYDQFWTLVRTRAMLDHGYSSDLTDVSTGARSLSVLYPLRFRSSFALYFSLCLFLSLRFPVSSVSPFQRRGGKGEKRGRSH